MRQWFAVAAFILAGLSGALTPAADDPPGKSGGEVIVSVLDGTEHTLTGVTFSVGTRRLGWLADPKGETADAKLGPVAVALREPNSTTYAKGVLTLIPVKHLESAKYDYEKDIVSLAVKGVKDPLIGSLEYTGINVLGIAGKAEGKAATFTAGVRGKTAVKVVAFPAPSPVQPVPKEAVGKGWSVKLVQSKKAAAKMPEPPVLIVRNLKALVQSTGGGEQLIDGIPVRKGQPVPFDMNLKRFEMLATDLDTSIAAAEIELGAGPEKVIAIPLTTEQDKKVSTLVGFLGEVDAGYKLFPLHTVKAITPYEKKVD